MSDQLYLSRPEEICEPCSGERLAEAAVARTNELLQEEVQ